MFDVVFTGCGWKNGSGLTAASEGGVLFGPGIVETDKIPIGGIWLCPGPMLTSANDLISSVACLIGTTSFDSGKTVVLDDPATLFISTLLVCG